MNDAINYAIDWWKRRHAEPDGYFPRMTQHLDWKLYEEMDGWFLQMAKPDRMDSALEIGCGYGQWMNALAKRVSSVDGFDIHDSLLAKFKEQLGDRQNLRMRIGDGTTIPFDLTYSLIYSISVFQHMPRAIVHGYLRESARLLSVDGRCVFHFRHADNDGPYAEDIIVDHPGDWSVGWTEDETREACKDTGLRVVELETGGHSLVLKAVRA